MTWEPELGELRRRRELAHRMGGEERVARQHASGRLTVRERIARLLDDGTFHETGELAGAGRYGDDGELEDFVPANMVIGRGRIAGRRVVVQGDDFTVRGGAADAAIHQKMVWAERAAHDLRQPLVRLVDGTGGGGSVKSLETMGFTYVPWVPGFELMGANLSRVPVVSAALGPCAGLGAARVVASHFSVIVRDTAQLFVAGPPVVAAAMGETPDKQELGGARTQTQAGAVDNEAADEDDALAQLRRFLSYLPDNVWEPPPTAVAADPADRREEELLSIVPRDARRPYQMRRVLEAVLDVGSTFETGPRYGRSLITMLARLDGRPVGVLASDPNHYAGGLTADASDKLTRFVDLCDTFRLPVVNLVDQPGFLIGTASERAGTIRRGTRALVASFQATVPWVSVLVRKVYGVAGAGHGDHSRLNLRYAWPSGDWGSLPIAGGLEAAYRRELEAAVDPAALRAEIEGRLNAVRSPFRTAERFAVEEIIDPRDTRPLLCDWAARAYELLEHERGDGPKARGMRP
ncbi:acyl-CoA carboxylase subunit beta [Capillimicrobium parvum]|uniref:Propionyl-CoA carboxylase beta chain n=1 Tax=Capillimicrobium parvum TaxID=2884022 RepID=A0A9E7BZS9_9ACTN|nr:carboxyl transferase domain-containing protein [Capillimicrobium parvum]UGS34889.1 Propionyl-CoA carboxylase beta chain [Capillimicrobium parvum]